MAHDLNACRIYVCMYHEAAVVQAAAGASLDYFFSLIVSTNHKNT